MGAWGTGIFENDTALDTIAEMSGLIENYYVGLTVSEDEHNIMLSAYLYLKVIGKAETISIDNDVTLQREIDYAANGLRKIFVERFKYKIIGNLYKCLDNVSDWNEDYRNDRRNLITNMIDTIAQGD